VLSPPRPSWTDAPWGAERHQYRPTPPSPGQAWRYGQPESSWNYTLLKIAVGGVIGSLLVPFLVVFILYADYRSLLSTTLPEEQASVVSGLTRIYDDRGNQIGLLREFDLSIPVAQADIPEVLKQAVVAVEDRRFYSHSGVDDRAVLRAIWADLTGGGYVEGASTLTQQYVRLLYLNPEKTLKRKVEEAALARRVEKELTKDEILWRYLDRAYLGGGAYGVGAASQSYFRKPVKDVSLSEAALLAGLLNQPSVNEPRTNPAGAEDVRMNALNQMLSQGRITQAEHNEAAAQRVFLADPDFQPSGPATVVHPHIEQQTEYPYYVDYVRRYLIAKYGDELVYRGGLRVTTALSPSLQSKAERAVAEVLKGTAPPLEMAMVSVDPRTGLVRALVGGRDFSRSQVNLALGRCLAPVSKPADGQPFCLDGGGSGRQPGSAFKPVTLAKAIEEGIPVTKVYSGPSSYRFPGCRGENCVVSNVESSGYGSLTLRQATHFSVNTVYAQLVQDVGVKETAEMAHRLGLTMINPEGKLPSGEPYGPSLTLGAAEVSPLDMAAAYAVFANRGVLMAASPVAKVEARDGTVLEDVTKRKGKRVLSEDIADQVNDVLKGVIQSGTGTAADIDRPDGTAGKTGTSEDFGDAWFVGYTPELSTAIWMGYSDSRRPLTNVKGSARVYGGTFAAPTWKAYMTEAAPELNLTDFQEPVPPTTTTVFRPFDADLSTSTSTTVAPGTTTPTTAFVLPTLPPSPPTTRATSPTSVFRAPPTTRRGLFLFPP